MADCISLHRGFILSFILTLALHQVELSVFLPASEANNILLRWRRASSYLLEEFLQGNLERECYEEICNREEAREVFENDASTDEFWSQYSGGFPCISQPCLNNGTCKDHIRSFSCTCAPGYEGETCAMDIKVAMMDRPVAPGLTKNSSIIPMQMMSWSQENGFLTIAKNECHLERTDGCQHFCHPGQSSYMCSCAKGYKLGEDHRSCSPSDETLGQCRCGPHVCSEDTAFLPMLPTTEDKCACGALTSQHIRTQMTDDICRSWPSFPWQVRLTNSEGEDFCAGVLLQENFVLTTAKCSLLHSNLSVKADDGEQIGIKSVHVHMRYDEETGENDVSLLELQKPLQCPIPALPVCVPERDFAEHVLIPGTKGVLSGWMLNGIDLDRTLTMLSVTHTDGEECGQILNVTVTTRTSCEKGREVMGPWVEGSVVTRQHKGTWFLTGILSSPPPPGQSHMLLLTSVPRYSMWFNQIMK